MGFFDKLFGDSSAPKNSGDYLADLSGGENLVDGKHTHEHAKDKKHDLATMKKCCHAELKQMKKAGTVPAPFYFERVAILSKKEGNYEQEVKYCEVYLKAVEQFYEHYGTQGRADVRKGPRYKSIKERLPKARKRLEGQQANDS